MNSWMKAGVLVLVGAAAPAWARPVDGGIDFQTPVTETARNVQAFHFEVLVIITVITALVTAVLIAP